MQIGMIGLGKMGLNMTRRLARGGHGVVAFDHYPKAMREAKKAGAKTAVNLEDLVLKLKAPRVVWIMVPAGPAVWETVRLLSGLLSKGDVVIDGGNSYYKDDAEHAKTLARRGISYMDIGVSGGVWGLSEGYCLMAGGEAAAFKRVEPVLKTLAQKDGYAHLGPVGAGHFAKMAHNGVEYALMQAYGEGFELMQASPYKFNLEQVAALWNRGSVVRSWLLELCRSAFKKDPGLRKVKGWVSDSGEGRWTVLDSVERAVPMPTIAMSLYRRFRSRQKDPFSDRVLAALRGEFGGHAVKRR